MKKKTYYWPKRPRCFGLFSSLLLPWLEAVDTFGRVVMAVVVMVVVAIVVVVVVRRHCGFSLPVV